MHKFQKFSKGIVLLGKNVVRSHRELQLHTWYTLWWTVSGLKITSLSIWLIQLAGTAKNENERYRCEFLYNSGWNISGNYRLNIAFQFSSRQSQLKEVAYSSFWLCTAIVGYSGPLISFGNPPTRDPFFLQDARTNSIMVSHNILNKVDRWRTWDREHETSIWLYYYIQAIRY
jgi:hypothetical protein